MKVVIIEDEDLAVWSLMAQLKRAAPDANIIATLDSVRAAVSWFATNPAPDLAFFDIQLSDGLSFDIFEQIKVPCPIIFTTAYNAYALRAFKVNSIDYLLKPVELEDLSRAMAKLRELRTPAPQLDAALIGQMLEALKPRNYRSRFMVKVGDHLHTFMSTEIDFFFGENKIVWLRPAAGRKYPVEYTLDELEDMLDPARFFRLNRQYVAAIDAIQGVTAYSNSRLKVQLRDPFDDEDIIVSREKAEAFREWLGK